MHNHLRNHAGQEELIQSHREFESGPIMTVLQHFESIALEIDLAIKVHLMEGLHGDLVLAMILGTIMLVVEMQVVLNRTAGEFGLLISAGTNAGSNSPEDHQDWNGREQGEEQRRLEASANLAR